MHVFVVVVVVVVSVCLCMLIIRNYVLLCQFHV